MSDPCDLSIRRAGALLREGKLSAVELTASTLRRIEQTEPAIHAYVRVLTDEALTVTRVAPSGQAESWSFNPYWVRLTLQPRLGRSSELSLSSHGKRLVFASFLTDDEREDFASALASALTAARSAG